MKSTGIVRNLDQLGRLVIPKETRKAFSLNDGDPVEIFTDEDKIILKKYKNECLNHKNSMFFARPCDNRRIYANK